MDETHDAQCQNSNRTLKEIEVEGARRGSEEYLILLQSVTEYAQIALRAVLLANGAGATAILSFLGAAVGKEAGSINAYALALSGFLFALGVAAGVLASFFAYLSQFESLTRTRDNGFRITFNVSRHRYTGIILSFSSLGLFLLGILSAIYGYIGHVGNSGAAGGMP